MKKQLLSLLCLFFISLTYAQAPGCIPVEWNGTSWNTPIPPNEFPVGLENLVIVTISGNYNTANNGGSFSCCELIITDNAELTIAATDYIEVQGDTTVNGALTVEHQGSFLQVSDSSSFNLDTVNGATATVKKQITTSFSTAVAFWSSPIKGKTVSETFNGTPSFGGYRYYFKTENFQDLTYEVNNNGAMIPEVGRDGIDDNGDDWNFAFLGLPVRSGVGYATRQVPGSGAGTYNYGFSGEFNNAEVRVEDILRNDANLTAPVPGIDKNPIFIGNPYASAIDLEAFLIKNTYNSTSNTNGILDGHVAIWSASAPPVNTNNGNQVYNFSESDFFYMNFSGGTFNPCDSLPFGTEVCPIVDQVFTNSPPVAAISSAQGFFANFSDERTSNIGDVVFNNEMRITGLNENFYKTSSTDKNTSVSDKLWLNLNSPSGVNENILLSYVDGASSGNDGRAYDLDLRTPHTPYSLIYFNIEGTDDKFRIQGKNPSDLNGNEKVSLGFYNTVVGPNGIDQEFAISITSMQGDFIANRTVFLKDNLLDVCHNLTEAPYFYTSVVGDFSDRFTIQFIECNFSEVCNTIFDAFESSIRPQGKCGKYRIKAPKGDYMGYDVVLTHEGTDINIPTNGANTTFLYTENGSYTLVLSIYDEATGALCYRGDVDIIVDCFNNDKKTLKLFPNPTKNTFKVTLSDATEKIQSTVVRNLMGTIVKQNNANTMRIAHLKPGVYFVEVTTKTGKIYRKQLVVK